MYSYCTCRINGNLYNPAAFCRSHLKYRNRKIKKSIPFIFQFPLFYYINIIKHVCVFITGGCCLCYLCSMLCLDELSWVSNILTHFYISPLYTDPHFTAKNMKLEEQIPYTRKNKGRSIAGIME